VTALLVLQKKFQTLMEGLGQNSSLHTRIEILVMLDVAVGSGTRLFKACEVIGLSIRIIQCYRLLIGG